MSNKNPDGYFSQRASALIAILIIMLLGLALLEPHHWIIITVVVLLGSISFSIATLVCRLLKIKDEWLWIRPVLTMLLLLIGVNTFLMSEDTSHITYSRALNTIMNLRNLKHAAMMYHKDNGKEQRAKLESYVNHAKLLSAYMDNPKAIETGDLKFLVTPGTWWVGYDLRKYDDALLKEKLAGKALKTGLLGSPHPDLPPLMGQENNWYQTRDKSVWMLVFASPDL